MSNVSGDINQSVTSELGPFIKMGDIVIRYGSVYGYKIERDGEGVPNGFHIIISPGGQSLFTRVYSEEDARSCVDSLDKFFRQEYKSEWYVTDIKRKSLEAVK